MKHLSQLLVAVCLVIMAGSALAENKNHPIDFDGLPDLIVRDNMDEQWVVREENMPAEFCSVQEGGITPGFHTIVRFTVTTPNVGDGDLFVGDPNDPANAPLFELAECHGHHHFKNYAIYELIDPRNGYTWRAAKKGFCMLDTDPSPVPESDQQPQESRFHNCGAVGIPGYQGISHGWADTYRFYLGGQFFVLDGGDGQAPVPPGDYIIRVTVNPPYAPDRKGKCPLAKDAATGLCHNFAESDYTNNITEVTITIPDHPGREGVGPLKNQPHVTTEVAEH
ncbi:MAG: lysyl oxidase family protein [Thermoanaerobaculia bacterium]